MSGSILDEETLTFLGVPSHIAALVLVDKEKNSDDYERYSSFYELLDELLKTDFSQKPY